MISQIKKLAALPTTLEPNTMYYIENANTVTTGLFDVHVTDDSSNLKSVGQKKYMANKKLVV